MNEHKSAEWIMQEISRIIHEKETWEAMYKTTSNKLASLEVENYQLRKELEKHKS